MYQKNKNNEIDGFKIFLYAGNVKGIGKVYADKLIFKFKENTKKIFFDENWNEIKNIINISESAFQKIIESWNNCKSYVKLHILLYESGLTTFSVKKLQRIYGNKALEIISKNPYVVMENIGVGFKIADRIALEFGIELNSKIRVLSAAQYILEQLNLNGDTYLTVDDFIKNLSEVLTLEFEEVFKFLDFLQDKDILRVYDFKDLKVVSSDITAKTEEFIFKKIKEINENKNDFLKNLNYENELQNSNLSEEQKTSIIGALSNRLSIITGGAGTGKTTIIRTIHKILESNKKNCLLLAPTGRAAQRLRDVIKANAMTLHKAIGYRNIVSIMQGYDFYNDKECKEDLLIIDEASMVDIFMMKAVLSFISPNTQIILVGDENQLPSVSCGSILSDLINSNICKYFKLTNIFRQSNESEIIDISFQISNGIVPYFSKKNNDCVFLNEADKVNGLNKICQIANHYFDEKSNQLLVYIITPMNRGINGANSINLKIQEICRERKNILKETIKIFGKFYLFDRVMQIKNNYKLEVFNGDIGIIIEGEYGWCKVQYDDRIVFYESADSINLALAYAITTHKSQGSEFPIICIPIFMEHYLMLGRKGIYTAITRASKKCILIGEKKALICAIKKDNKENRKTLLNLFFKSN